MPNREFSSLDRFVNRRAPVLMGIIDESRRIFVLGIVAGVYSALGLSLGVGALASGNPPQALALAIQGAVFLGGAGVITGIRAWLKQHVKDQPASHVRLTPEARALVHSLIAHIEGWAFGWRRRRIRLRRAIRRGLLRSRHDRRSEDVLSPRVFHLLERAAAEYNRIYGALALGAPHDNATLDRLAPNIRAATDEAMAEILHAGALLEKFPESGAHVETEARAHVEDLKELADQTERLQASNDPLPAIEASASRIHSVLEELRSDQRAREELGQSTASPGVQRLYRAP
jgi:hypothetical protein